MITREIIQKEAEEVALSKNYGTLDLAMRLGKTKVAIGIANHFKKVLVSYPNKAILAAWKNDAEKFDLSIDHIVFTTFMSLHKHDLKNYDCVIIDEIDQCSLSNWQYIEENLPNRLYGLTGTVPNKGDKLKYIKKYCPVIYKKHLDETVGKINKDYKITVHLLNPDKRANLPLKSGKFWSESQQIAFFERKYVSSKNFNDMLFLIKAIQNSKTKLDYVKQLSNKINRGLIFVETTNHCDELGYPAYHSKEKKSDENLQSFANGEIHKLVTINQLKAGVTISNLNTVIILHCYSSNNKAAQKLGRALNYVENMVADIHIVCLKGTRDEQWVKSGLIEFDQTKIQWIQMN